MMGAITQLDHMSDLVNHLQALVRIASNGNASVTWEREVDIAIREMAEITSVKIPSNSVLQDWVMELPLREQGTLLTSVRGCDLAPKIWDTRTYLNNVHDETSVRLESVPVDTQERRLTAWIRWAFMNPADPREVDIPGAFFQSNPPSPFKPSAFGHYPQHWYAHVMHALEVIGYRHPDGEIRLCAFQMYKAMANNLHLPVEVRGKMIDRLSEDRIESGEVVS